MLYRAAHVGDREAMEGLLQRIRPRLQQWVATKLGPLLKSRVEADDLAQEILIKAYAAIPDFEPRDRGAFYAWLFTIARNTIRDHARHQGAARRDLGREAEIHSGIRARHDATPSMEMSAKELREQFVAALADLPDQQREVIRLRKLEHKTTRETAEILGISTKYVTVLLARARQSLNDRMET